MAQVARTWIRSLLKREFVRTLKDVDSVLGFETLNEPHPGWLGLGPRRFLVLYGLVRVVLLLFCSLAPVESYSHAHKHSTYHYTISCPCSVP